MINFEGTRRKFFFLSFVFFFYIYINRRSNRMFIENKRKKLTSTYTKFTVISDFRLRSRRTVACVSNRLSADYRNKTSNRELKRAKGSQPWLVASRTAAKDNRIQSCFVIVRRRQRKSTFVFIYLPIPSRPCNIEYFTISYNGMVVTQIYSL